MHTKLSILTAAAISLLISGCAGLIPQIKFALDSSNIREYVIAIDNKGALICSSAQVTIDETGAWKAKDFKEENAKDCLSEPVFAYKRKDRAAIEALFESFADAYYEN